MKSSVKSLCDRLKYELKKNLKSSVKYKEYYLLYILLGFIRKSGIKKWLLYIFLLLLLISFYFISLDIKKCLFPIFSLVIYDLFFISFIYPFIKSLFHKINIKEKKIDFNFLFRFDEDSDDTLILAFPKTLYQTNSRTIDELSKIYEGYFWLERFYYEKGELRYYLLPYFMIASHILFFLLLYIFFLDTNNSIYTFVFLLFWLFYATFNIENLLNLKKYRFILRNFASDPDKRNFLRQLNLIFIKNQKIIKVNPLFFDEIEKFYEENYKQKMDYIVAFIATVVFIGLLTFIVSSPSIKCKKDIKKCCNNNNFCQTILFLNCKENKNANK